MYRRGKHIQSSSRCSRCRSAIGAHAGRHAQACRPCGGAWQLPDKLESLCCGLAHSQGLEACWALQLHFGCIRGSGSTSHGCGFGGVCTHRKRLDSKNCVTSSLVVSNFAGALAHNGCYRKLARRARFC